ncbi:hypothetical protein NG797_22680 [Laspinema sp. D5]|nr:hypothetical protein [Laspinema sp. D3d]
MGKLNVLHLHRMGDPQYRRESVRTLEYMIKEVATDINCLVHDTDLPFPEYLKEIDYHLIVLGPTFLCNRYYPTKLKKTLSKYRFIASSNACKIALPQDDYDCSSILDQWMVDWNIDLVYSVCPNNWDVLYPNYSQKGQIKLGYTGYISESWIRSWAKPKPRDDRRIDVSYRASNLPANFGSVGQLKGDIARRFTSSLPSNDLYLDISVDPQDMIPGNRWHNFLEDSKFCLVTPSGSSLLDPKGEFRKRVNNFCKKFPNATFEDIASECFPGEDKRFLFTAISPRNIEAALSETVQIATPGTYSGLMQPIEHFIPLEESCSNISSVLTMMRDKFLIRKISRDCKDAILAEPRLQTKNIVYEILSFAENTSTTRNIQETPQKQIEQLFERYYTHLEVLADSFWFKRRLIRTFLIKIKTSMNL